MILKRKEDTKLFVLLICSLVTSGSVQELFNKGSFNKELFNKGSFLVGLKGPHVFRGSNTYQPHGRNGPYLLYYVYSPKVLVTFKTDKVNQ